MFWTENVVKDILKRKDKKYLVTDYKTPSGKIHVGALRGVAIHEAIAKGLADAGKKTEFYYGFDDLDPMDDLPENLKKNFSEFMGVPLCNIPSPDGKAKNFACYFAEDFIKVYNLMGINPKTLWASELYRSGTYNKAIEIILDKADEIRKIYKNISGSVKPSDWYPFQVICPKCGKIGTTRVNNWDGKFVSFICDENLVSWAKGCGYRGKTSPFDGGGKMPYKVETAAKWFVFGTSVELAGKDHYTKGGTFDVAKEIARKIFKINPAYGFGYEWFLTGGKKMSSSKGVGEGASDIANIISPEILKFLMVRTRPQRAIDFDPYSDTILLIYDEYDRCINNYLIDPNSDLGQAYYYSKIDKSKPPRYRLRFSKVANLIQMYRTSTLKYAEEEKASECEVRRSNMDGTRMNNSMWNTKGVGGDTKLTKIEKKELKSREDYAKLWLANYASENYKFEIKKQVPLEAKRIDEDQKRFLSEIAKLLQEKKWKGDELHQEIHVIKKKLNIEPRKAFSAIYISLIGKESGPQAGWLIASLDRDFVIKRLDEILRQRE